MIFAIPPHFRAEPVVPPCEVELLRFCEELALGLHADGKIDEGRMRDMMANIRRRAERGPQS